MSKPRINSRAKGANGEREFCKWLADTFNLSSTPTRNLEQVRSGGADVICEPFAFEVKRVEAINKLSWWNQVERAVNDRNGIAFGLEPAVAFRQNSKEWEFLISAKHIGLDRGFLHLTKFSFVKWVYLYLDRSVLIDRKKSVVMIR